MTKLCIACNIEKPLDNFQIVKKNKRHSRCIECRRQYDNEYHSNRSIDQKLRKQYLQNERRKRNLKAIRDYKSSHGCCKCGEKDYACLDFHHKSNDKEIDIGCASVWSIERLAAEIAKCVVICSNCHRKLHRDLSLQGEARVEEYQLWKLDDEGQNLAP